MYYLKPVSLPFVLISAPFEAIDLTNYDVLIICFLEWWITWFDDVTRNDFFSFSVFFWNRIGSGTNLPSSGSGSPLSEESRHYNGDGKCLSVVVIYICPWVSKEGVCGRCGVPLILGLYARLGWTVSSAFRSLCSVKTVTFTNWTEGWVGTQKITGICWRTEKYFERARNGKTVTWKFNWYPDRYIDWQIPNTCPRAEISIIK